MTTLIYIRSSKDGSRYIIGVELDGVRTAYCVDGKTKELVSDTSIGEELDLDVLFALKESDEKYRSMKKALSLLAYADNNKRTLYMKLLRAGFSKEVSSITVSECESHGYINEQNQLERLILKEANGALRGPRRIIEKLCAKGYKRPEIEEILSSLEECGEIDFRENFDKLLEKHSDGTEECKRALMYKYGYRNE